ncbi:MAG TPA: PolC-type DNA polymerase III [Syntrophomonadaceae bacterium]|nr:PolC-type DNA polymerase III [Syntrophomonadaceae bacterium]
MGKDFYSFFNEFTDTKCSDKWVGAQIKKLEVFSSRGLWRLHIGIKHTINIKEFNLVRNELLKKLNFLNDIDFVPILDNQDLLKEIVEKHKGELSSLCFSTPELKNSIRWEISNLHIDLKAIDELSFNKLLDNKVCIILADWFWENYLLRIVVRAVQSNQIEVEKDVERFTPQGEANIIEGSTPPPADNNFTKRKFNKRGKRDNLSTNSVPIQVSEIEEGLKTVIVEGEIWNKETTQLRDGRYVISYFLTDYLDSILIKTFIDKLEDDAIRIGDWIRVKGSVRYDNFAKELVLYLESYFQGHKPERLDSNPEKRVELHLHTKMSAMDGLTEIDEAVKRAAKWNHPAIAITDHGSIQAFPHAYAAAKRYNIKVIYGVEAYLVDEDKKERPFHVVLLAKNTAGLQNLYNLISVAYLDHFYRSPKIPRKFLKEFRQGILVGTACEAGELYTAILNESSPETIEEIASFYDYLEIQPNQNNEFLIRKGIVKNRTELEEINKYIFDLGSKLNIPVVATGDVHFLDPNHEIYRRIIMAGQGYADIEEESPLYFKTTDEMLSDFSYLGQENAKTVVIDNPVAIAEQIENIKPVPDGFYPPKIDGAEEDVTNLTWLAAHNLYGENIPLLVEERIKKELGAINAHGYSVLYLIAHKLVKKSNDDGYLVGSRGSVGSSVVAFFTGITEVNPLPPHYRCPRCKKTEFIFEGSAGCGADLPIKNCADCDIELATDGFDIPFETFLGFEGDKVPDIDLNFSGEYQSKAHQFVEDLFGKDNVFRAGTISTIAEKTAFGFVKKYMEAQNLIFRNSEVNRLVKGITGVRRTTGQHPGGLIVVPHDKNIHEFTPLQHPADKKDSGVITTHFEYHAIGDQLVKLDILGHDDPTVIKELEDLTGVNASTISLNEKETMKLFSSVEPLGIEEKNIDSSIGTFGIPEFGTKFVRQMLEATRPTTFSELVRISGLSHGTDVWLNNAQNLIANNTAQLNQVICTRDDIMSFLIYKGMEKEQAFKIMEQVRKGRGLTREEEKDMRKLQINEWYIDSCNKIKYMFPKAHAVAYVTMAFRIAYFKVYYPLAFYSSFFSIRAEDFELGTILAGYEAIKNRIKSIESEGYQASQKDKKLLPILELSLEMYARGYNFFPVDITSSSADKFIIKDNGLIIPFSALPNVGVNAAHGIAEAIKEGEFVSVEEFQVRTHLNKTAMEVLRRYNCFGDLPESTQISLFG